MGIIVAPVEGKRCRPFVQAALVDLAHAAAIPGGPIPEPQDGVAQVLSQALALRLESIAAVLTQYVKVVAMGLLEQLATALGDRYRIERELGQGGMAIVFLAEDLKHHRRVAIKLLKPELSAALGRERFLREITIAATLQHPHILPLYDSGETGGQMYYVMPFVEGESLRQRISREQQLPLDDALQITRDVGSALTYAHERDVIHRDIKPENILLSGGHAVVADFGIARALHAAGADQLTASGMVVGTPYYMSPEQSSGVSVDGRCDQYSLACTLYEMLIGEPPFGGASVRTVFARHWHEPVPSLRVVRPTVPQGTEEAITRAMAKLPADRFPSIQGFLEALASPDAGTVSAPSPVTTRPRVRRWLIPAIGLGLLVAVATWWLLAGRTANHPSVAGGVAALAVLPFQDAAGSAEGSYLADGMTEGLMADLAEIGSLKVIAGPSGAAVRDQEPLGKVARQLGVDAVVTGEIRRTGDSVWVSVHFIRAPDSTLIFTNNYERRLGELPDLQREISTGISGSIGARVEGSTRRRLDARREVDARAYEAYLRGRFFMERGELDDAKTYFEQACRLAPDWAPPEVGLAGYYTSLPFYSDVPPALVLPRARSALAHALALDESLAEAHAANAYIRAYYEWDWRAAEQEFRHAIELRPNYADAYFSYSRFLASRRRFDEAIAQLARAVELDPLSLELRVNRALLDYFAGRYDAANNELNEVLKRDSTDVQVKWGLALVAEQQGRVADAIAILESIPGGSLNRKATLGHAYAIAGQTARARSVLDALHAIEAKSYVPSYYFALIHTALGERDQALRYLERAYEERSTVLAYMRIDPRLAALRDEPRFVALAGRLEGE